MVFRVIKEIHGPYMVHLCIGQKGDTLRRPLIEPRPRAEHKNAFAVVSGWFDRVGPDGIIRFTAGQLDDELPDYPLGGEYKFVAGDEGVVFWCIGRFPPGREYVKTCVRASGKYVMEAGALGALVAGTVNGIAPPLLIKPRQESHEIELGDGTKMLVLMVR